MLISKDLWIKNTGGDSDHRRSPALRRLDNVIGIANRTEEPAPLTDSKSASEQDKAEHELATAMCAMALSHVNDALEAWMTEQKAKHSNGWRDSRRNKSGAVEALILELQALKSKYVKEDAAALQAVKDARDKSIPALFKGCKCISRSSSRDFLNDGINAGASGASAVDLVRNIRRVMHSKDAKSPAAAAPEVSAAAPAAPMEFEAPLSDLINKAFGVPLTQLRWEVDEAFFRDTVQHALSAIRQEMVSAIPFIGLAGAAIVLGYAGYQLSDASSKAQAITRLQQGVLPGDSKSALESIHKWQLGDIQLQKARVTRAVLGLGSQIAGVASAGTLYVAQGSVGICNAIVALTEVIIEIGRQYQASRALTTYLNNEDGQHPLGREIFSASPLAGAYYLLNTPSSHIALQLVDIGSPGWQEEVERLVLHEDLAKARAEAARLIELSRYQIVPRSGGRYIEAVDKSFMRKLDEQYFPKSKAQAS